MDIETKQAPFAAELHQWYQNRERHRMTHKHLRGMVQSFDRLNFWRNIEYKFLSFDEEKQYELAQRKLRDFEESEVCLC